MQTIQTIALSRKARDLFAKLLRDEETEADTRTVRELERAGLVDSTGKISEQGEKRRVEFLPVGDGPSTAARQLLKRRAAGENVPVCDETRSAYRELAAWGLMLAGHSFAGGDESVYVFTREGFEHKNELMKKLTA